MRVSLSIAPKKRNISLSQAARWRFRSNLPVESCYPLMVCRRTHIIHKTPSLTSLSKNSFIKPLTRVKLAKSKSKKPNLALWRRWHSGDRLYSCWGFSLERAVRTQCRCICTATVRAGTRFQVLILWLWRLNMCFSIIFSNFNPLLVWHWL